MLSYVATPVVADAGVAIAYQQYQVNHRKIFMDQYDRRLRIYEAVKKLLSIIVSEGKVEIRDLLGFRQKVAEADFLFPPDVMAYLDELYSRAFVTNPVTNHSR